LATLVDFEDLDIGTVVQGQYSQRGVIVNSGEILDGAEFAHSGQDQKYHYLSSRSIDGIQDPPALTFTFPNFAKSVKLYAGANVTFSVQAKLTAFKNAAQEPIAEDGWRPIGRACQTLFSVSTTSFDIWQVRLDAWGIDGGNIIFPTEIIDDLEFEPGPPIQPPETEPSLYGHILAGIRLGEGGVIWGPHGPIHVPPIGPQERAILAAFVANGAAQMIGDVESRRALQHAALSVIAREAKRLSESL